MTSSATAAPGRKPERLKAALDARLAACGLALHPEKTRVVHCRDTDRPGDHPVHKFTFLGYEFRPRLVRWRAGQCRVGFTPAVGPKALKAIRTVVRRWRLHRRTDKELADLARMFNPIIRGWILLLRQVPPVRPVPRPPRTSTSTWDDGPARS